MGVIAFITFIFALSIDSQDPIIWTRVVPMLCVIGIVVFGIVTGVVIALYKKGKKPRG